MLADDQPLVRAALRMVIADIPDLEVVGEAGTGDEAVRLTEQLAPDVVVMDIRMPGLNGSVATAKTYPTRLLAKLDARDRVQLVIIAYEAGLVSPGRPSPVGG